MESTTENIMFLWSICVLRITENKLFEFTIRAFHKESIGFSNARKGVYALCYARASNYQDAIRKGVAALAQKSYQFDNIEGPVREIDPAQWSTYICKIWPEFVNDLPDNNRIYQIILKGGLLWTACWLPMLS